MTPKKVNPNDAAFARPTSHTENYGTYSPEYGLTKREYFAAKAMQGLLAIAQDDDSLQFLAKQSVRMADFLIEELNKQEEK
jgi:hypothetical protein